MDTTTILDSILICLGACSAKTVNKGRPFAAQQLVFNLARFHGVPLGYQTYTASRQIS